MKVFVMTYNPLSIGQPAVAAYLDTRREIKNWYTPYLGAVLLVTDDIQTPSSIAAVIRLGFPALLFAVVQTNDAMANGWMPQPFWELLQNPRGSGRWEGGALADLLNLPPPTRPSPPTPGFKALADLLKIPPKK